MTNPDHSKLPALNAMIEESIAAALAQDKQRLERATWPLFDPATDYDARDVLYWVVGMIRVSTAATPRPPGGIAVPNVGVIQDDGSVEQRPIDQAPPGLRCFVRMEAAWLNRDPQAVVDLWVALMTDPADPEQHNVGQCMAVAVEAAAHARRYRLSAD